MSVEDKVISASIETTQFSKGAADILKQLQKINETLAQVGKTNGLDGIEKSASKISFAGITSAIDKLKGKFTFREADQGFSEVEKASSKVTFLGIGTAIDKVKGMFRFPEADQAFAGIERSSSKVTFQGLGRAIDSVASHFSVIEGAASVALGNLAAKAISSGTQAAKGLSISPVTDGLHEYETNLNSVQTILANTAASGAKLKDVNAALLELNKYSDKTIYNFSEMAKNIGTFTAAGVDLDTATASEERRQCRYGRYGFPARAGDHRRADGHLEGWRSSAVRQDEERHDRREVLPRIDHREAGPRVVVDLEGLDLDAEAVHGRPVRCPAQG
jgi:hypothetical protein